MVKFPDKNPICSFTHTIRSRYSETDQMGYVYYGRYLEYFEAARTEMIRDLGLPYKKMEEDGVMLPVIHAAIDYKSPLYYDEEIRITVYVFEKPLVKLDTWYRVNTADDDSLKAAGRVSLCFMDRERRRPCRAPGHFLNKIDGLVSGA